MDTIQIVEVRERYGSDFYVYEGERLHRVCPSRGMADEIAAGLRADYEASIARERMLREALADIPERAGRAVSVS